MSNKIGVYDFVCLYPVGSRVRHFAARLLNETRSQGEATEANIARVALECGVSDADRETVIGAALDAGLVRSTMSVGSRSVACLARA